MEKTLYSLTAKQFETAAQLCEAIVPGSEHVGPAVYLDSIIADMDEAQQTFFLNALNDVSTVLAAGDDWTKIANEAYFAPLRALAIEAYFSDFRQPGYDGPSAWDDIGYKSAPWANRAKQDWSFLKCYGADS